MKKITALILILAMALSFTACDESEGYQSNTREDNRGESPASPSQENDPNGASDYITIMGEQYGIDEPALNLNGLGLGDEDIIPLKFMKNLERLLMSGNNISDITPLSGLTSLEILYLSENSVSDISPLSGLINLNTLNLENNNITDLTPLHGLSSLEYANLSGNSFDDEQIEALKTALPDCEFVF